MFDSAIEALTSKAYTGYTCYMTASLGAQIFLTSGIRAIVWRQDSKEALLSTAEELGGSFNFYLENCFGSGTKISIAGETEVVPISWTVLQVC